MSAFLRLRLMMFTEHKLDTDVLTLDDLTHVLEDVLKPAVQEGLQASVRTTRARAIERAIAEIEREAGRPAPPLFRQAFDGALGKAGWYDAFSLYVAEELKTNERFRSIFQTGQLADLRDLVSELSAQTHQCFPDLGPFMDDVRVRLGPDCGRCSPCQVIRRRDQIDIRRRIESRENRP
jgi:hypothetical protein